MHACRFNGVWLLATPWTVACQTPLSMGFPRHEYWSGLPYPLQGIFLTQGSNPHLLCLLHRRRILYHLSYQESPETITLEPLNWSHIPTKKSVSGSLDLGDSIYKKQTLIWQDRAILVIFLLWTSNINFLILSSQHKLSTYYDHVLWWVWSMMCLVCVKTDDPFCPHGVPSLDVEVIINIKTSKQTNPFYNIM